MSKQKVYRAINTGNNRVSIHNEMACYSHEDFMRRFITNETKKDGRTFVHVERTRFDSTLVSEAQIGWPTVCSVVCEHRLGVDVVYLRIHHNGICRFVPEFIEEEPQ